jgi:hypothetical protein
MTEMTVTKLKNARGRIVGYRARFEELEAEGATPQTAREACQAMLVAYLRDHQRGSLIARLFERTLWIEPCRYAPGFTYRLEGSDCVHGPYETREAAEDRAVFHCAQNAWTLEVDDDAAFLASIPLERVRRDLAPWVAWQRRYAAARAAGLDDAAARLVA